MNKYYISQETGSVLTMIKGELHFTGISNDNTFDADDFWPVDEAITGGELVRGYETERRTLSDVYSDAKKALVNPAIIK